jgi:multidrug efflux system membrane fusion protein
MPSSTSSPPYRKIPFLVKEPTMIDYRPSGVDTPKMSRPSSRRWLIGVGFASVTAIAATAGLVVAPRLWTPPAANAGAAAPAPRVPVSVAVVEQRDAEIWDDFSGRLEAVGRVEIRPRVAGAIIAARFREGAPVRQGDVLFNVDPAPYAAEVRRLEAQVTAANARLALAVREQQRAAQLVPTGATTQRDLDQRSNELHAAEANLLGSQAALDGNRLNLEWTEVRAPIAGRVGKIEVTPGNLVAAGPTAPVLTTLVSVDPIYASFEADEQSVARALASLPKEGDLSTEIQRIPVRMGTLGTDGTPLEGRLQLVDNVVDAHSGTVRVRAVFANPDGRLLPGQFAHLRLGQATTKSIMAIDERAIGTDQDRRFVMVVGEGDKAVWREVRLGAMVDGLRVVTDGLKPGERIVVSGLQRIRPGSLVAPTTVAMNRVTGLALTSN